MEDSDSSSPKSNRASTLEEMSDSTSTGESGNYWKLRHDNLLKDYDKLQKLNQVLEERLLNVVEAFEKKKEELEATVEYEKSTLMADVNKLSTKLVDARIKLHDYEEKVRFKKSDSAGISHNDPNII